MRASDLPTRPVVSRRAMLGVAPLAQPPRPRPATSSPLVTPLGGGYQTPHPLRTDLKPLDGGYEAVFGAHNHHPEARSSRGARRTLDNHQRQARGSNAHGWGRPS